PGVANVADAQRLELQPGDEKLGVDFSGINTQPPDPSLFTPIRLVGPNGQLITPAQLPGSGVIRGRITRSDGFPIARATVSTNVSQRTATFAVNLMRSAQTDDDGVYELGMLPEGQYRVTAAKLGYATARYGQKEAADPDTLVDLADGPTRTRIDVVLPPNSNVMGRVVDEFGDPVENASVALSQIKYQGGRRRLVGVSAMSGRTTDDLGRYRIYAVPAGEYVVTASVGQVASFELDRG